MFDFDGDGDHEILAQNDNRYLYVFGGRDGRLLAELQPNYPAGWGARPINGPEASILVQGGARYIIAANSAAIITVWRFEGIDEGGKFVFDKRWERRLDDCHANPGMDAKPVLVDVDQSGSYEILAQTEEVGVFGLKHTGAVLWKRCIGGGNGEPGIGDLDGDGGVDAVWPSDGGVVTAMNASTGSTKWTYWVGNPVFGLGSGAMPVGPTVGNLNNRGGDDVVVGVRDSSNCEDYTQNHAMLFAIDGAGRGLWNRQPANATPLTHTHPILYDVDNNGWPNVIWADWNTQGHHCGAWEVIGESHVFMFDSQGGLRWTQTMGAWWNNKDLALADVDDDGVQEVLANGPSGTQDGIWYLNSRTGAREAFVSASPWKVTRGAIVADLWDEGTMQWIIPVYAHGPGTSGGGIQVYDTGVPYDAGWPHLPYP